MLKRRETQRCVGSFLVGSGTMEVLNTTFVSVNKMLIGKKFANVVTALRTLGVVTSCFEDNPDLSIMDGLLNK